MNSAVPRTTSSMPSVTRKEGIFSLVTNQPLTKPMKAAASSVAKGQLQRQAPVLNSVHIRTAEKPNTEPTEVELAGGHQQRHRQGDQAELDREGERVADIARREEMWVDRREHDELEHEQDEGPELGPCHQPT